MIDDETLQQKKRKSHLHCGIRWHIGQWNNFTANLFLSQFLLLRLLSLASLLLRHDCTAFVQSIKTTIINSPKLRVNQFDSSSRTHK